MPEWKDTINLPRTGFPMKASLPTSEPETLARWASSLGIALPELAVTRSAELPLRSYELRLRGVPVASGRVPDGLRRRSVRGTRRGRGDERYQEVHGGRQHGRCLFRGEHTNGTLVHGQRVADGDAVQRDVTHRQRGICEGRNRCGEEDERCGNQESHHGGDPNQGCLYALSASRVRAPP